MSKDIRVIRKDCCNIWNNLKDKTQMIDYLIESKQQVADLEAKLAELTKKYELASLPVGGLVDTARNLEQQLAEKEKEIERLREINLEVPIKQLQFHHNQDKISFAVEQLNQAKGKIQHNILFVDCDDYVNVIEEIDNQIKQLKEGK